MTSVVIPITDDRTVIPLRRHRSPVLYGRLKASVDLLDLGELLRDVGAVTMSAGEHVMMLHELPTEHMRSELRQLAVSIYCMVAALDDAATSIPAKPETT